MWSGAVFLSSTEKVYCVPFDAPTVLVIDADTAVTSTIRGLGEGECVGYGCEGAGMSGKWSGAAVSPLPQDKGSVFYCIPYNHPAV